MKIEAPLFGKNPEVDVGAEDIYTFPEGLPGFERLRRFALFEMPGCSPFQCLQSLEDERVGFILIAPQLVWPGYSPFVEPWDLAALGAVEGEKLDVWAIVTMAVDPAAATVNLVAPVLVSSTRRVGRQTVLADTTYSVRHPLSSARTEPDSAPANGARRRVRATRPRRTPPRR